jgi:hypothetical protein
MRHTRACSHQPCRFEREPLREPDQLQDYCRPRHRRPGREIIWSRSSSLRHCRASHPEFKELAARALELTKGEATTLQYDWFFSDDETKCVVRETYANSDAILAHMVNLGDLIGKLADLGGGLEIEAFGDLSPELLEAAAAFEPTVYRFFQGK